MREPRISKLQPYSYGIVASNKERSSVKIEVTPLEDLPFLDGELTEDATTETFTVSDIDGNKKEVSLTTSSTVTAVWLPIGQPNRMTPPDVRRGEQVMIYKFGDDENTFYWNTLRNDLRFRKLETVIFAISATQDEDAEVSEDTTYLFECSSHNKMIRLHTSQADGEAFGYDIELDTDASTFTLTDTEGNKIHLSSKEKRILLKNSSGNYVDLTDGVLSIFTSDSINAETKAYSIKAETYDLVATTSTVTSDTLSVTAETTHNGNVALNGNLALAGGMSQTAGSGGSSECTMASPLKLEQTLEVPEATITSLAAGSITATTIAASSSCTAPNIR